jgi:hypothetical protein
LEPETGSTKQVGVLFFRPNPPAAERYEKIHIGEVSGTQLIGRAHQRLDDQQTCSAAHRLPAILENLDHLFVGPVVKDSL